MKKLIILIILIILILLLCGCEKRKCIKSHEENSICTSVMCYLNGNTVMCYPITMGCTRTICDEYED